MYEESWPDQLTLLSLSSGVQKRSSAIRAQCLAYVNAPGSLNNGVATVQAKMAVQQNGETLAGCDALR
jgi:hypothetical protein